MTDATVSTVDMGPRRISRRVVVNAAARVVFELMANPHRHPELDGSGTVRDTPVRGPQLLHEGAKFSVGMKQLGVPYTITSTVTAFEPDRLVEWQHPMGHRWRWELEPTSSTSTAVTETFDYTTSKSPRLLELFGQPEANAAGITKTLQGLAARFASA